MIQEKFLLMGQEVKIEVPYDAIRARIAFITEDRKIEGFVLDFSVRENLSITKFRKSFKGKSLFR